MERAYKVWGGVLLVFFLGVMALTFLGSVLLLVGVVNLSPNRLVQLMLMSLCLYVVGVFMREKMLGNAMRKKYSPPCRNVSVTVDDLSADSILYRQGLRSGDVVVTENGKSLESDTFPLQTWWQNKDSVALTVLRNGQEVQVTLKKE